MGSPRRPSALIDTRVIYCGDNLEQLAGLPDSCIDLVYIDPPFNSNRNYEVFWGETKEKRAFEDRHASTQAYIDYMRPRCQQLARVLKPTGSFYYHCDWHASHYVKVMLDQIFGENHFSSEIVWKRTTTKSDYRQGATNWPRIHDSIFVYQPDPRSAVFNQPFRAYTQEYVDSKYRAQDEDGRRYMLDNLTAPGGGTRGHPTYELMGVTRAWRYNKEKMLGLVKEGRIVQPSPGAVPRYKRYLDEVQGIAIGTFWDDVLPLNSQANEALGYPTQKPLELLDRIINASSNPNDIILDAFCGCGTALVAAQNLGRQWIGIDISPTACRVMAKRLKDVCKMRESEPGHRAHDVNSFIVRDLPWTIQKLKAIPPFEFENWAVIALGGIPNKVQVGDMGIDGRIYPVGTKPAEAAAKGKKGHTDSMFAEDWFPIQVKQMDKVGRPDIDQFEAVMAREDRQRGFFVAFGFSSDAERECAAFHKKSGRIIKLITVQEILDEQHVQKM
ncbi:MAG: restriction endonuclease [Planctomycetes bacterium]|nr:restriction endonuclease [Planctomycetota bacterium]